VQSIFTSQIKHRKEQEDSSLKETMRKTAQKLGLQGNETHKKRSGLDAFEQLLNALKIRNYKIEDDELTPMEDQLKEILERNGIMSRRVNLSKDWWKDAQGPMLGNDKEGNYVTLMPTRWGMGYKYTAANGKEVKVNAKTNKELYDTAICFYPALPQHKLSPLDLFKFSLKTLSKSNVVMLVAACLIVTLFGMFTPLVNKKLFDTVIPSGIESDLWPLTALLIGAAIGTALLQTTRNLIILRLSDNIEVQLQNAVMARTFLLETDFFYKNPAGSLTMKICSISTLCAFINENVFGVLLTALFSIGYLIQVFVYAKQLLLPSIILVILQIILLAAYYFTTVSVQKKYLPQSSELQGLGYNLFAGIQKIKLTGSEKRAFTRWLDTYSEGAQHIYNPTVWMYLLPALINLVSCGGTVAIFYLTIQNKVSTSDYIAFSSAFGMISAAVASLAALIPQLAQIKPLLRLTQPILESVPETEEEAQHVHSLSGNIEVSNVSFRYSEDTPWVIQNLSLKIKCGEYVGIVGKSGCGKSTLLRLLLGFEKPQSGGIYYDYYDLQKTNKPSLRRHLGCCLQNGSLFTGDLFHNITITAPWSTHEQAWEALRMASIDKDVDAMPMKLHTVVSEGGGGFSGGQKQRLLIARALIGKPSIVFFDEATSALDNISQKAVSDNMEELHCTRVVIAHRLSTIRHCDRIIVMDKGNIVEEGNFEQLMEKKGLFYEMSKRQM